MGRVLRCLFMLVLMPCRLLTPSSPAIRTLTQTNKNHT
jgi:hypothetical protein